MAKDVELEFHGTINLLRPLTPEATSWINENIPDGAQWFGDALAVEPRYCPDIVAGMIDDGLAVCIGEGLVTSASYTDATCKSCGACARPRGAVIGFPAHGAWRRVEAAIAARDVPPGQSWAFTDHRTMAEVLADEAAA